VQARDPIWRASGAFSARQIDWLVFATALVLGITSVLRAPSFRDAAVGVALLPFASLPLLGRRRHPGPALAILALALAVSATLGRGAPGNVGVLFGLYGAARYGSKRLRHTSGTIAFAVSAVGFVALAFTDRVRLTPHLTLTVYGAAAAWMLGDAARTRHRSLAEVEERTERVARGREEHARQAAVAERIRIARELHDIVIQNVTGIAIQATAGQGGQPAGDRSLRALAVIERTASETLRELRALLGLLRASDPRGEAVPLMPTPTILEFGDLVEAARAAGNDVSCTVEGDAVPLDSMLRLAAYRVLQEALANVARHAPGAQTDVTIRYGPNQLEIDVTDHGPRLTTEAGECPRPISDTPGYGLIGMRERVELSGGELSARPTPQHGFRIRARLPIGEPPPERGPPRDANGNGQAVSQR
jgi:signal transduction histidine kinase